MKPATNPHAEIVKPDDPNQRKAPGTPSLKAASSCMEDECLATSADRSREDGRVCGTSGSDGNQPRRESPSASDMVTTP